MKSRRLVNLAGSIMFLYAIMLLIGELFRISLALATHSSNNILVDMLYLVSSGSVLFIISLVIRALHNYFFENNN